ncbi:hypothetical protein EES45_03925 [Streptomyces sp. ADI97-07]|nr:hypothetical protein EES45_03925 [Streptomyces sp. ADI97-07]GHA85839.1 hypothetical protein GCM10010392_10010 [Streptomyces clavifer]
MAFAVDHTGLAGSCNRLQEKAGQETRVDDRIAVRWVARAAGGLLEGVGEREVPDIGGPLRGDWVGVRGGRG